MNKYLVTGEYTRFAGGGGYSDRCGHKYHRTAESANQCADKLNRRDCIDGGNLIWSVEEIVRLGTLTEDEYWANCRQEDGMILRPMGFFDTHEVIGVPGGLGYQPRRQS